MQQRDDHGTTNEHNEHRALHIMAHFLLLALVRDRPDGITVVVVISTCCCSRAVLRSGGSRYEKISNKISFGIIDIDAESSTTDRIIVIVETACFIHDGAYR